MKRKEVDRMTPEIFKTLSYEEQVEFLEVCKADFDVVHDLQTDRNRFKRIVDKLTKQLRDLGVEPCTQYDKELLK